MPWEKNFDVAEVLNKVMNTFWARGYEATSMQDLVDSTGINRGSLYATYGDKHALFVAALNRYDGEMRQQLLAGLEENFSPREAIARLFHAFLATLSETGSNRGCFLTNTALELAPHDRDVGNIVAHAQEQIEAFFARMLRKGKEAGEIPASVKTTEASRGLLASLIGLVVLMRSRPDRVLLKSVLDDALRRLN